MSWTGRLKLLIGLVVVVAVVGGCTVLFNRRQAEVRSTSATIAAETYVVGTDYGGTVTSVAVRPGETVHAGQRLFTIKSLSLLQETKRNPVSFDTASYSVGRDGTMTFKATVSGVVAKLGAKVDDYVQPDTDLATIDKRGSLFVQADYTLTPRDYERLSEGAAVDLVLPNQHVLPGVVHAVSVRTTNGQAQTQVRVTSPRLVEGAYGGLVDPGTPIDATLHLRQDDLLAGAQDATVDFVRQLGL